MPSGIVFNIQRFCLHDGPGIRTTVFLKGCGMRCLWCHNPEAISLKPEVNAEGKTIGAVMSVESVMQTVEKDRRYYENSGGGLTLSGGEPLFQFAFAQALLRAAREHGLQTCAETSGQMPERRYAETLTDVDLFLYDIKAHDPRRHQELTGVTNTRILANLDFLYHHGAAIVLRCPLIPGVNDSPEHLRFISRLAEQYPDLRGIELMPFHNMAAGKWRSAGQEWRLGDLPSADEAIQLRWLEDLHHLGCDRVKIS
jgi:glycyl-radical enzyme activating protein